MEPVANLHMAKWLQHERSLGETEVTDPALHKPSNCSAAHAPAAPQMLRGWRHAPCSALRTAILPSLALPKYQRGLFDGETCRCHAQIWYSYHATARAHAYLPDMTGCKEYIQD